MSSIIVILSCLDTLWSFLCSCSCKNFPWRPHGDPQGLLHQQCGHGCAFFFYTRKCETTNSVQCLKISLLIFKECVDRPLSYRSELLTLCIPASSWRSSGGAFLVVDKWRLRLKVSRLLSGHPRLWNDLPEDKRLSGSVNSPKSLLKSHFYDTWYHYFMWSFEWTYNVIIIFSHFNQETRCHSFWLCILLWWRCSSWPKH